MKHLFNRLKCTIWKHKFIDANEKMRDCFIKDNERHILDIKIDKWGYYIYMNNWYRYLIARCLICSMCWEVITPKEEDFKILNSTCRMRDIRRNWEYTLLL